MLEKVTKHNKKYIVIIGGATKLWDVDVEGRDREAADPRLLSVHEYPPPGCHSRGGRVEVSPEQNCRAVCTRPVRRTIK